MTLRRLRSAALLSALAASAALAGCSSGREGNAGREGRAEDLGHLAYNVFISRELNLKDVEDQAYFQGPEAGPGYAYYGVFLSVCNEARGGPAYQAASDFSVVDTQGNTFQPTALPHTNLFAYRPGTVTHRQCIPQAGSIAAAGPTAGALLLFKLPLQATENRPLDLVIKAPPGSTGRQSVKIELDV